MRKCLAFVLGGGGARGALQVGALRALFENGYQPDLLVGTSIGAANAVALALWGVNLDGIAVLEKVYQAVAEAHLMDPRLGRLTLRALSMRPNYHASQRIRDFFITTGISPSLRFDQIRNIRLGLVASDLDSGQPVIYGLDPGQSVLDGLMASIALPPWFAPVEKDGQLIVDGGAVSNVPIEPALTLGATEIIALDLNDPAYQFGNELGLSQYIEKLVFAVTQRQIHLEAALARAQGVPVHLVKLRSLTPTPIWEFKTYRDLMTIGYEVASHKIANWNNNGRAELTFSSSISISSD